jgi:hypothetical protein
MLSSGLAQVSWGASSGGVHLICTETAALEWFISELKKYVPTSKHTDHDRIISGETIGYDFKNLKGKDREIGLWFITKLCEQGWEPFEVLISDGSLYPSLVKLRRIVKEKE